MKKIDDILCIRPIQKDNEDKFILTIGDTMVSEKIFDSEEDAELYVDGRPIDLIFGITVGICHAMIERRMKENGTMINNNKVEDNGNN